MQAQGIPSRGGAAFSWTWGTIAGVVLGVMQILLSLLALGGLKTILDLLVWLVGFFLMGLFAARHTGRVGTGALAGLVTGLISGLMSALLRVGQIATNGPQITQAINQAIQTAQQRGQNTSSGQAHTIVVVGILSSLIVTVALELGLGAGVGALGGLVGRRPAPPPPVESLWIPQPSAHSRPPQPPGASSHQE